MAAEEKDNLCGNKKLEYQDQNSTPDLHEAKVNNCVLRAVPLFTSALAAPIHKGPSYLATQLAPWLFRGKGGNLG